MDLPSCGSSPQGSTFNQDEFSVLIPLGYTAIISRLDASIISGINAPFIPASSDTNPDIPGLEAASDDEEQDTYHYSENRGIGMLTEVMVQSIPNNSDITLDSNNRVRTVSLNQQWLGS